MACKDCNACSANQKRHREESMLMIADRANRRLWITIVLLVVLLFGSNLAWVIYENSYTDVVIEQEAEADGDGVAFNSNGGEVVYYASDSEADNQD